MPSLATSPENIVRWLMVAINLGTDPNKGRPWPVYADNEPDSPDNVITIGSTQGLLEGRFQNDGEVQEHYGIQIQIRAVDHDTGWVKACAIAITLDESVYDQSVLVGSTSYLVHSFSRKGSVIRLGRRKENSNRHLFTINFITSLRQS